MDAVNTAVDPGLRIPRGRRVEARAGLDVQGTWVIDEYFFQLDGPKSLEILEIRVRTSREVVPSSRCGAADHGIHKSASGALARHPGSGDRRNGPHRCVERFR
jgi:hypothetical protein